MSYRNRRPACAHLQIWLLLGCQSTKQDANEVKMYEI